MTLPKKKPTRQTAVVMPVMTKASQTMKMFKVAKVMPTAKASIEVATARRSMALKAKSF